MKATLRSNNEVIAELDKEIQLMFREIKNSVTAQINVTKEAFPGTIIQIGRYSSTLITQTKGVFKIVDGVLNI